MNQLSLFLPFTPAQQAAMIDALAAQRWGKPDAGCNCDRCRHARDVEAVRNGTANEARLLEIATALWNLPGIHQSPSACIDYDPHEELHRAIWKIRRVGG